MGASTLLVASMATPAQAFMVDLGTGTSLEGWQISNDGGASYISPTARLDSNALWPDPFGTPGVWQGMFEFFVPDDVENVSLSIFDIGVDDRVVLSLNGTVIPGANAVIFGSVGSGVHDFGDGRGPVDFEFTGSSNWLKGDPLVTSENFIYGGVNQLIAYVNNTNTGDPAALPVDEVELTAFFMQAEVNGDPKAPTSVPEPSSFISLLGLSVMAGLCKLGKSVLS
ncbi:hypothetical protein [Roseofilum sp. Belize Diploria]|nr:hypothetical protein [Roseofilum sp. Belize Diploria]MBP0006900.1 hypothetical protein [Roseofilum sp. Belize Diploria]